MPLFYGCTKDYTIFVLLMTIHGAQIVVTCKKGI